MSDSDYSILDLYSSGPDEAVTSGQNSPFVLLQAAGAPSAAGITAASTAAGVSRNSTGFVAQRWHPCPEQPDACTPGGEDSTGASSCSDSDARRADNILESAAPSPGGAAEPQPAADPLLADLDRYDLGVDGAAGAGGAYDLSGLGLGGEGEEGEDDDGDEGMGLLAGLDPDTLSSIPPALLQRLQQLEEERDELAGRLLESDAELSSLRSNYQQLSQTHASNQTWLNQLMAQQMENLERRQRRKRALAAMAAARAAGAAAGGAAAGASLGQPQVVSLAPIMSGLLDSTVLETGDFDFTGEVDSVLLDQEELAAVAATAAAAGVGGSAGAAAGEAGSLGASPLKAPPLATKLAAAAGAGADKGTAAPVDVMALAAAEAVSPPGRSKAGKALEHPRELAAKPAPAAAATDSSAAATQAAGEQKQEKGGKQKEDGRKDNKAPTATEAQAKESATPAAAAAGEASAGASPPVSKTEVASSQAPAVEDRNGDAAPKGKSEAAATRTSKIATGEAEPARSASVKEAEPVARAPVVGKTDSRAVSQGGVGLDTGADTAGAAAAKDDAPSAAPAAAAAATAKPKAKEASTEAANAPRAVAKAAAIKTATGGGRKGGSATLVFALLVVVALAAGGVYVFLGGRLSPTSGLSAAPAAVKVDSIGDVTDAVERAVLADATAAPAAVHTASEAPPAPAPPPPPPDTSESAPKKHSEPPAVAPEPAADDPATNGAGAAESTSDAAGLMPEAAVKADHMGFVDVYDSDDEYEDSDDDRDEAAAAAAAVAAAAAALDAGENVRFATLVSAPAAFTPGQYWCADGAWCEADAAGGGNEVSASGRARAMPAPSPVWELLRAGLAEVAEAAGQPGAAVALPQPSCESLRALATSLSATDAELASAGKQPAAAAACTAGSGRSGAGECRLPPSKTAGSPYPVDARAEVVKLGMGELEKRWRQLQRTLERLAGEGDAREGSAAAQPPVDPAVQAVASWALSHLLPAVAPMVRSVVDDDELPESLKRAHKAASDVARVCSESGPQLSAAALGRLEAQLNDMTNIALVHVDGGGAAAVEARLDDAARCMAWIAPRAEAEACRLRCSPRGRLVGALGRLGIPRALLDGALALGRSGLDERDGVWRQEQPPGEEASAEEVEAWLRSTQHLADWVEAALAAKEGGRGAGGEAGVGNASGGVWQPLLSAIGAALHEGAAAASEAVRAVAEAGDWRRLQLALALEAEGSQRLPGYVVEAAAQAAQQALAAQEVLSECGGCESLVQGDGMGVEDAGAPGPACRAGLRSLGVEMRAVQATAGGGAAAAVQGLAAAVRRIRADVLDLAAAVAVVRERCLVAAEGVLKYRQAGAA